MPQWICCQIGAREHYENPATLHQAGQLSCLITDAWFPPDSILGRWDPLLASRLRGRFRAELAHAPVRAFSSSLISFELRQRLRRRRGWARTLARNDWFQRRACRFLARLAPQLNEAPVVFAYSYAALGIFQFARQQGWPTVLGQIDPGIREAELIQRERERHPELALPWQPPPDRYWQAWRQECQLADRIAVNSVWSRQLLQEANIDTTQAAIVPLRYTPSAAARAFVRRYPAAFSAQRPLRVLFLGQVNLRKGVAAILEAMAALEGHAIEFWFVGPIQIRIPPRWQGHPQVVWTGAVDREQTDAYYRWADVFLFPTLSDGFGLTQLEAQAWKLPAIASAHCGRVVTHGKTGWMLEKVDGEAIASLLNELVKSPQELARCSHNILRERERDRRSEPFLPGMLNALIEQH